MSEREGAVMSWPEKVGPIRPEGVVSGHVTIADVRKRFDKTRSFIGVGPGGCARWLQRLLKFDRWQCGRQRALQCHICESNGPECKDD